MATTRDRERTADEVDDDVPSATAPAPWHQRPIVGTLRGLSWWGAILFGFAVAAVAATIDLQVSDGLTRIFQGGYLIGCLAAVCAVRRKSLFTPMVQPPLIIAVVVPGVVLYGSGLPDTADRAARLLAVAEPLINSFPTMAVATGATLLVGIFRLIAERNPEPREEATRDRRKDKRESPADADDLGLASGLTASAPPRTAAAGTTSHAGRGAARPVARSPRPPSPDQQSTKIREPVEPPARRTAAEINRMRPLDPTPPRPPQSRHRLPPDAVDRPWSPGQQPPPRHGTGATPPHTAPDPTARPVQRRPSVDPRVPQRRQPPPPPRKRPWEIEDDG